MPHTKFAQKKPAAIIYAAGIRFLNDLLFFFQGGKYRIEKFPKGRPPDFECAPLPRLIRTEAP